jgi:hypothetical protein
MHICNHCSSVHNCRLGVRNDCLSVRNRHLGIHNHRLSIRNRRLGIRDLGLGIRDYCVGIRDPRLGVCNPDVGINRQFSLKGGLLSSRIPNRTNWTHIEYVKDSDEVLVPSSNLVPIALCEDEPQD